VHIDGKRGQGMVQGKLVGIFNNAVVAFRIEILLLPVLKRFLVLLPMNLRRFFVPFSFLGTSRRGDTQEQYCHHDQRSARTGSTKHERPLSSEGSIERREQAVQELDTSGCVLFLKNCNVLIS